MSSSYTSLVLILTVALVITVTAAQNCGPNRAGNPKFRSDVKKVVDSLVEELEPRSQIHLSRSPSNAVGAAAGAAICYTRNAADCRACLREGKAVLSACNSTTGMHNGGLCAVVFWRIFD